MRKSFFAGLFFTVLVFCISCERLEPAENGPVYFSVKGFFEQQTKKLQDKNSSLFKEVSGTGEVSENHIENPDWKTQLEIFSEADISKKSWIGSFAVDTLKSQDSTVVKYAAIEELPVKFIQLVLKGDSIYSFSSYIEKDNFLYRSQTELLYKPFQYFLVRKKQDVIFMDEVEVRVRGRME